jgi:hypothetical protein
VEVVDAEEIESKDITCPVCYEKIFSEIGKNCRMCGMVLKDSSKEFCSKKCRTKYTKIKGL